MAEDVREAVEMYNEAGMMEDAYKVRVWLTVAVIPIILLQIAVTCMNKEELVTVYGAHAKQLAEDGKLREAERYVIICMK